MATVIDSLIVKLGLDSSGFDKGQKRTNEALEQTRKRTQKVGKDIEASGKQGAEFFNQLQGAAVRFFAALTIGGGAAQFAKYVVSTGANLSRMADNLGTSADKLSRWGGAVRQNGGSLEAFLGTAQGLSASLTELRLTGNTGILPYLQALGVAVANTDGSARTFDEILGDIGDKLKTLQSRPDAFNIGKSLGIDEGTLNLLLKSRQEIDSLLNNQKPFSDADADAARKAAEDYAAATLKLEQALQPLVIKVVPAFEALTSVLVKLVDQGPSDVLGLSQETKESIGRGVAYTLSVFGNESALEAVRAERRAEAVGLEAPAASPAGAPAASPGDKTQAVQSAPAVSPGKPGGRKTQGVPGAQIAPQDQEISGRQIVPRVPGTETRAERNLNPGNLEFRGQAGATAEPGSGRFAQFQSAGQGVAALVKQLQRYGMRGLDTLSEIVNTYAPSSENNTQAYIGALSKQLGVGADQQLDLGNAQTLENLVRGISRHEAGVDWLTNKDIMSGLQIAGVQPASSSSSTVSIGEVKVYTASTDAAGIARDMRQEIVRQADYGIR